MENRKIVADLGEKEIIAQLQEEKEKEKKELNFRTEKLKKESGKAIWKD